MTEEQKKVLEELWANDQYPERGEIKLVKDVLGNEYFERTNSVSFEIWHLNGQLKNRGTYKDGKLDGLWEEWDREGTLIKRENYKDGIPHGLQEEWYENGRLERRVHCKNGRMEGLVACWHRNGQQKYLGIYKNNSPHGVFQMWGDDGELWKCESYKNGKPDGLQEELNADGTVTQSVYKGGELQTEKIVDKFSDWNAILASMIRSNVGNVFTNEVPTMTVEQKKVLEEIRARDPYPERGEIKLFGAGLPEGDFSRWSPDGHCERWYKNGQLKESYTVDENGKKNGVYESWHQNGELERLCCYVDDKLSGHLREWWYNGQLKCSCSFEQGKLDGIYEAWDSTGDLLFSSSYCMGYYNGDFPLEGNETPKQITTDSKPTSSILSETEEKLGKVVRHTFVVGEPSERVETDDFLETKEKKKITLKPKKKGGMKL